MKKIFAILLITSTLAYVPLFLYTVVQTGKVLPNVMILSMLCGCTAVGCAMVGLRLKDYSEQFSAKEKELDESIKNYEIHRNLYTKALSENVSKQTSEFLFAKWLLTTKTHEEIMSTSGDELKELYQFYVDTVEVNYRKNGTFKDTALFLSK